MPQLMAHIASPVAPVSPTRTRTLLSALLAGQQPSGTFCKSTIRPLAKTLGQLLADRENKTGGRGEEREE